MSSRQQKTSSRSNVSFTLTRPSAIRRRRRVCVEQQSATDSVKSNAASSTNTSTTTATTTSTTSTTTTTTTMAQILPHDADFQRNFDAETYFRETVPARGVPGLAHWLHTTVKVPERVLVSPNAERLSQLQPAFVLHLLATSFRINNQPVAHAYNAKTRALLDAVDSGRLPPDVQDMLVDINCPFYDGAVVVELHDYRALASAATSSQLTASTPSTTTPATTTTTTTTTTSATVSTTNTVESNKSDATIQRILLKPDHESLLDDVNRIWATEKPRRVAWGPDEYLALEKRLLHWVAPPLCLDPSPHVGRVASVLHYNRLKMNWRAPPEYAAAATAQRRQRRSLIQFLVARGEATGDSGGVAAARRRERRREHEQHVANARNAPLLPLNDVDVARTPLGLSRAAHASNDGRPRPPLVLRMLHNRVLRMQGALSYVVFKAYEKTSGGFEGLMRVERQPQHPDKHSETIRFSLGSIAATDAFIAQLKALCKRRDVYTVVFDSALTNNNNDNDKNQNKPPSNEKSTSNNATSTKTSADTTTAAKVGAAPTTNNHKNASDETSASPQAKRARISKTPNDNKPAVANASSSNAATNTSNGSSGSSSATKRDAAAAELATDDDASTSVSGRRSRRAKK